MSIEHPVNVERARYQMLRRGRVSQNVYDELVSVLVVTLLPPVQGRF